MSEPTRFEDLMDDDLLLDRLGRREPVGRDEPLAGLLSAVAAHADQPLTGRTRRRRPHSRRLFAAFAIISVGASGAGVAAAVTLPSYLPGAADRARIERIMDANAASNRPSVLLSRLGIPADADLGAKRGLVLVRRVDGQIVLVPASAAARASGLVGAAAEAASDLGSGLTTLTGTPRPTMPHSKHASGNGSGGTGALVAPGGTTAGSGDAPSSDTAVPQPTRPALTNSGKAGKGQTKVKTTTVSPPPPTITLDAATPPPPSETPETTETLTATRALAPTGSDTGGSSAKKVAHSTEDDESQQADESQPGEVIEAAVRPDPGAPAGDSESSPGSGRPATPERPTRPGHPQTPEQAPDQPTSPEAPATEPQTSDPGTVAQPAEQEHTASSSAPSSSSHTPVTASAATAESDVTAPAAVTAADA